MLLGTAPLGAVMMSLTFLIAVWPMGLIETVRMSLVVGMGRLSKRQIVIRDFAGVEALAVATTICSDKTGIMTENQISVKKVFVDGRIMDVEGDGYDPESGGFPPDAEEENPDLPLLLTVAAMCTNTEVKDTPEGWTVIGDSAEGAQIVAAMKGDINKDELGLTLTKIAELPFDPKRKRMPMIFRASQDELFVFTSGSLESILDVCSAFQLHGHMDSLDVGKQRAIWAVNQSFAKDSMRSLAFAYCQLKDEPENYTVEAIERNLVFVGMMGIIDPPKGDARAAVRKCIEGGVSPIILTSDSVNPAFAFAQYLGIVQNGSQVLTGEELDILGEKEYSSLAQTFSLYADISPAHRLRIVRTLNERGEITAVIGSHASDAPAVKEADTGIAAGKTGSSVTINAADIVLMDDSFAAAVNAIEGIRGTYSNSRKIIRYFLSGSAAAVGTLLLASIISMFWSGFSFPPLSFLQMLWVNLLAGSICAFAMIFNPVIDGVMKDGPYDPGRIFGGGFKSRIAIRGVLTTVLALIAFVFSQERAATAAVTVLIMSQLAFAFQCRRTPDEGLFRKYLANKLLLGMTFLAVLLHLVVIYISPVNKIFGMEPLMMMDWIPIIAAFIICSLPLDELFKSNLAEEEYGEVEEEPAD
jgi:Ca2+-transporting ATPase